jgi:tRNA (pseudouridine54-N1)-methyltransferase
MREFVYFSNSARTSGNFTDLMQAGRMDIVCHTLIAAFFLSHGIRQDVKLHMIFNGPPNPPQHLEFVYHPEMPLSKKDVAGLIKRMLYKCKQGQKTEVFPGCFIEKKSFIKLLEELQAEDKTLYILDKEGRDIRELKNNELKNAVFILGDHSDKGLPEKEMKRFRNLKRISLGPNTLFASQTVVILNNELDRI